MPASLFAGVVTGSTVARRSVVGLTAHTPPVPHHRANVRLADDGPGYRAIAPEPSLAPFLRCLWVREPQAPGAHSIVVPDGCMDIVWIGDDLMIAGPATLPIAVDPGPGTNIAGIRFHPGAAAGMLGYPASTFLDLHARLEELWPREARELQEKSGEHPSWATKLRLLHQLMASKLADGSFREDETVRHGVALLSRSELGIHELAAALSVSDRHLLRLFADSVGYGPKKLQRVLRFQKALRALRSHVRPRRLSGIAFDAGYADQAHMTRDFIDLSGSAPMQWLTRGPVTAALSH